MVSLFLSEDARAFAVLLAHGFGVMAQRLFLGAVHVLRDSDVHGHKLVAPSAAAQVRNPLALQAEDRPGLGPLGDGQLDLAVQRGHFDLCAECGLGKADILLHQDRGAVPLENGMRADNHRDQQITRRTAVCTGVAGTLTRNRLSVVDAGRHLDGHLLGAAHAAHSAAGLARLVDDLARAVAFRTRRHGLRHAEGGALGRADLSAAAAVRADLGRGSGCAAGALAVGAGLDARDIQLFLAAEGRLLKADVQLGADVVAPARRVGVARLTAAPAEAEDIPEA